MFFGLLPASSWGQAKTVEEAISGFKAEIAELKEGVAVGKHSKVAFPSPNLECFFSSSQEVILSSRHIKTSEALPNCPPCEALTLKSYLGSLNSAAHWTGVT